MPIPRRYSKSSVFVKTLTPLTVLSKISGMRTFSYSVNSSNIMIHNDSLWYAIGNLIQVGTFVLMTSIMVRQVPSLYVYYYDATRYWTIIIAARLSEKWSIKLINEINTYDRKFNTLPPLVQLQSPSMKFWLTVFTLYALYFSCLHMFMTIMLLGKFGLDHTLTAVLFDVPRLTDFTIVANTFFFLGHLGCRFQTLNEFWKRLPAVLLGKSGRWTKEEVVMLVECCRMLHSNLSNLLRVFSFAYGPVLMVLFLFLLFDMFYDVFLILYVNDENIPITPAVIILIENIIFVVTLLGIATWTNIQKKKIISYIRSTRINGLPEEIIEQMNFFMKQVSSYESYEMSAFGVFNYDLKLFLSITMTLFKFIATMIQLGENTKFKSIVDQTVRVFSNHTNTTD